MPIAKGESFKKCPVCGERVSRLYERDNTGVQRPYYDLYKCSVDGIIKDDVVLLSKAVLEA